jgi:hypothetical protein
VGQELHTGLGLAYVGLEEQRYRNRSDARFDTGLKGGDR